MLEIGSLIDGKYKILNKIGQGGMSVVYLAMNERANKQWAIKEVRKDGVQNFETVKQGLIVETDMLKKLQHQNLPSIIDVIDGDGTFLIVMDYIEGKPLSDAIKEFGAQPQEDVIEWAIQLCDVLGYLHSRKPAIIYRDMKPSNVMLKPDGNVMLIDFGTAREYKERNLADTCYLGTQGYAAPEQFGGQGQTDARTDIYCLGATLYHLVTGCNPCDPPYEMKPIRQCNPKLSSGLEEIILKCTQRNPEDRYQNCAELMYALENYKELDIEYKKKQSRKWRTFLVMSMLTISLGAGAIGFKLAEKNTLKNSYDQYISEAKRATNEEQKIKYCKDAIQLEPSQKDAYLLLLEGMKEDDIYSSSEDEIVRSVIAVTGNKTKKNIEYLHAADPQGYYEFAYNLANAYYYYYGESGQGNKALSVQWYKDVQETNLVDDAMKERAVILGKIGSYYAELGSGATGKEGNAKVSYKEYWNDLLQLAKGDIGKNDNQLTIYKMYNEIVSQIFTNAGELKKAGVKKDELLSELQELKKRANANITEDSFTDKKQMLLKNIENARIQVDSVFSNVTVGTVDRGEEGLNYAGD